MSLVEPKHINSITRADAVPDASPRKKNVAAGEYNPAGLPAQKQFWKTPIGLVILVVIALVIITTAVGE